MFASIQPASDWRRTPAGRRAVSLTLAVLVHLLLLLLLLRLAPPIGKKPPPGGPTTIYTVPAPAAAPQAARRTAQKQQKQQAAAHAARAVQPPAAKATAPRTTSAQPWVLNPDLAGFSLQAGAARPSTQVADSGASSDASSGGEAGGGGKSVGRGANGQLLYKAEWVREPTDAEMSPYMPHGSFVGGWADIACRTVPRFHVEDCEELGQSPAGSGLSRALREAAWQFLVRPPRLNGKAMVGEWVRIHFDFVERKERGAPAD